MLDIADVRKADEVLHSAFDIQTHKKTFINYCEVLLFPDGHVEYAVPSHQEKLLDVYAKMKSSTPFDIVHNCSKWKLFTLQEDIMKETGIAWIWYDHALFETEPTQAQLDTLSELVENGIVNDGVLLDLIIKR